MAHLLRSAGEVDELGLLEDGGGGLGGRLPRGLGFAQAEVLQGGADRDDDGALERVLRLQLGMDTGERWLGGKGCVARVSLSAAHVVGRKVVGLGERRVDVLGGVDRRERVGGGLGADGRHAGGVGRKLGGDGCLAANAHRVS